MVSEGLRVVVTGGGAGIGRAIAESFLAQDARVAICDADENATSDFAKHNPGAIAITGNVVDESQMVKFLDTVESTWGGADVVCANAGTGGPTGPIEALHYEDWQNCIATNVHGTFLTCRWAARVMRAQRSGLIVLTSSTAGQMGYPLRSPYAAAKWAVIGLAKTLAVELGPAGVRVNAICPGAVEGERMDRIVAQEAKARNVSEEEVRAGYVRSVSMQTWVSAQDIAAAVTFLASDAGTKISGQVLAIDGHTESLAPRL